MSKIIENPTEVVKVSKKDWDELKRIAGIVEELNQVADYLGANKDELVNEVLPIITKESHRFALERIKEIMELDIRPDKKLYQVHKCGEYFAPFFTKLITELEEYGV